MRFLSSSAALLLCAGPLTADALEPSLVDARARVLIHVDVAALGRTTLFRLLWEDPELGIEESLRDFEGEIGLDPMRDVLSLTVYSIDAGEHWIALLRTTEALDSALEGLRGRPGYAESEVGAKTIHSLREDGQEWHGHLYRSSAGGERLFVVSEDVPALIEAVRVVDGEVESLDEAPDAAGLAVHAAPSPGAVLFVHADRGLGELGDFVPTAEVSRLVEGVSFECGEVEGQLFATLRLTAATAQDARDVHDVIQGGLAFASLISGRSDGTAVIGELVRALAVRCDGFTVTFDFRYSAAALYEGLTGLREHAEGEGR